MKQNIYLILYGNEPYEGKKKNFLALKNKINWFDDIFCCGPDDLSNEFKNNKSIQPVFNGQTRGGGWWTWKPQIIYQKLNEINDNDILIYIDAGCSLNVNAEKRFKEYIELINNSKYGILSFITTQPLLKWTNSATFDYHNIDYKSEIALSNIIMATVIIIKKNTHSLDIIQKWRKVVFDDPNLFTNYYNKMNKTSGFKDHRHDQSNFSILCKKYGSIVLDDETFFSKEGGGFKLPIAQKYPFWATRKM